MSSSYTAPGAAVNTAEVPGAGAFAHLAFAGATVDVTPAVAAVGQLHFEGNLIPHSWYHDPSLRHEDGKANLVAITLLADICYWYRPAILRDEVTGQVISVKKRFAADKLHWAHDQRAAAFGLTKRQVQDGIAFLRKAGLISVEIREKWTLASGTTLYNQVFIEPDVAALQALSGLAVPPIPSRAPLTPPPEEGVSRSNVTPPPFKRDTPPAVPGHPPRSNGRPLPVKREPLNREYTETSTKSGERSTFATSPDIHLAEEERDAPLPSPASAPVQAVIKLTGDASSQRRFEQLLRVCDSNRCMEIWREAEAATRKRLRKSEPVDRPGAYFCTILVSLLEERQIFVPVGTKEERATEKADVRSQIAASLGANGAMDTEQEAVHG